MTISLKAKIIAISIISVSLFAVFSIFTSRLVFLREIDRLYLLDYRERIDNFRWEYKSIDAISAASDEVQRLQDELLTRLRSRYMDSTELRAAPYIFNGDGEVILWGGAGIDGGELVASSIGERIRTEQSGAAEFTWNGREYWTLYSYYEPWDWYTGYYIPNAERHAAVRRTTSILVVAGVAAVALLVLGYVIYLNHVLSPLRRCSDTMANVAAGNLTETLVVRSSDEIGEIASSFNGLVDGLKAILGGIQGASRATADQGRALSERTTAARSRLAEVTRNASQIRAHVGGLEETVTTSNRSMEHISSAMSDLGKQIDDQFAAVTESSAAVEEMSASLVNVANIARAKLESTNSLRQNGRVGAEKVSDTSEAIREIQNRVADVSSFVDVIRGIADQTNLLSMNAAIEAAHAGDSGKGFAVVAEEIRKLAEVASEQAAQIASTIEGMEEKTSRATESGQSADSFFSELDEAIQEVVDSFHEIADSTAELSSGSDEINKAISSLNDISVRVKERSAETGSEISTLSASIREVRTLSDQVAAEIEAIQSETNLSQADVVAIGDISTELNESMDRLNDQVQRYRLT